AGPLRCSHRRCRHASSARLPRAARQLWVHTARNRAGSGRRVGGDGWAGFEERCAYPGLYNPWLRGPPRPRERPSAWTPAREGHVPLSYAVSVSLRLNLMHDLSWCKQNTLRTTGWNEVQGSVSLPVRSALEKVLDTQDGASLSREECLVLAHAAGNDLFGLVV